MNKPAPDLVDGLELQGRCSQPGRLFAAASACCFANSFLTSPAAYVNKSQTTCCVWFAAAKRLQPATLTRCKLGASTPL